MTENETPADRLRAAAAKVRENWGRGRLRTETGGYCALGAICDARIGEPFVLALLLGDRTANQAVTALHEYLATAGEVGGPWLMPSFRVEAVGKWNDYTAADAEQVAATLEKAAARLEESAR